MSETATASDLELLKRYTRDHTEDAFAELVRRHVNLVHSAALRQVRSPQLAEEVAQSVFTDLARSAAKLNATSGTLVLTAWLYQVTRRTAIDVVRREARRQLREQIATEMNTMNATTADWTHVEPLLDEAMSALDDTDRTAVLLRYFENKSLREVGATLGTSDDAAQKRVGRAVERLREFFSNRGVTVGASGLVVVISTNAVQAAPVGLALTISTAAALTGTTIAATVTKTIAMTTLQKAAIAATIAVLAGSGIYEARRASQLRDRVQSLQQQQSPLAEQIEQSNRMLADATNRLAALSNDNERLNRNTAELLRLRNEANRRRTDTQELARLQTGDTNDPALSEALSWRGRVNQLKQHLERNPGAGIPELQLATTQDWLNAVRGELKTEEDYRRAMSGLRNAMEGKFANKMQNALKSYMDANNNQFPTDLSQLQSYFKSPVDEAILQRYTILPKEQVPNLVMGGDYIISTKSPVDAEFDSRIGIGPNGWGSAGNRAWNDPFPALIKTLDPVMKDFAAANSGREPANPSELLPYIKTSEQRDAYDKALKALEALSSNNKE